MLLLGNFLEIASLCLLIYALAAVTVHLRAGRPAWLESACRATFAASVMVTVVSVLLVIGLLTRDFRLDYVARYTSTTLPLVYTLTAFWAGQAGSLLLWLWLLLVFTAVSILLYRRKYPALMPWFVLLTGGTAAFFNLLLLLFTNPMQTLEVAPAEGQGLNPLLQNVGMIFHPPTLFVGYVGFTVPFALALAALLSRNHAGEWHKIARPWTVVSWLFLTVGIILGAQWAYVELGWGGYWAWDPVENASFIPWLSATALLHTSILQNRLGIFKKWNAALGVLTFLLCIFGTFITRSGFIESVHAFGRSSMGYYFLGFLLAALAFSLAVIYWRRRDLEPDRKFGRILSKEGAFALTNLLLMAFLAVVLIGTVFPSLSELFVGRKVSVQAPFFNKVVVPFAMILLPLLGICPLLGWFRTSSRQVLKNLLPLAAAAVVCGAAGVALGLNLPSAILGGLGLAAVAAILIDAGRAVLVRRRLAGEPLPLAGWRTLWQGRRRYAAYTVHFGLVCLCLGVVGSSYYTRTYEHTGSPGSSFQAGPYRFEYVRMDFTEDPEKQVLQAILEVRRDGQPLGRLEPEKHLHRLFEQPMTEVAIRSGLLSDLYVIFSPLSNDGRANFQVLINPLVLWIWLGGILMALGGLALLLPRAGAPRAESSRKGVTS